jgi:hypothetical protein
VTGEIEADSEDEAHDKLDSGDTDCRRVVEDHLESDLEEIEPWPAGEDAP